MTAFSWIVGGLGAIFVLDAIRLRGRLSKIAVLAPSDDPVNPQHQFLVASGVVLDAATKRAASAYARSEGLEVLDLVPRNLGARRALGVVQTVDPSTYRRGRLAPGRTAGHAILATSDVCARSGVVARENISAPDLAQDAVLLKRYACVSTDLAVAPDLKAAPEDPTSRLGTLRVVLAGTAAAVLVTQGVVFAVVAGAPFVAGPLGAFAIVAFHLQPLLATAGTSVRSGDLLMVVVFRTPLEIWTWLRTISAGSSRSSGSSRARASGPCVAEAVEALRPQYEAAVALGIDQFFEERRTDCPRCGSGDLKVQIRTYDRLQFKPGTFTLERCLACNHIFQNPRLSIAGLDYYYADFYDGLGAEQLEFVFGTADASYLGRARARQAIDDDETEPRRWLDVGTGHGHFCSVARDVWPNTTFDGLDMGEAVEDAQRRGWVSTGYRGMFPDLAGSISGAYDVVSMHHYLEHTREPLDEIAAAYQVLEPGGYILIEGPDPQCAMRHVLGRWWVPWFQPQHQHLLSAHDLDSILVDHGFEIVRWQYGEAHQPVDFLFAAGMILERLGPPPRPWRPNRGRAGRFRRALVWTLGTPLILLAIATDRLSAPFLRRAKHSNTYRVLARKHSIV